VSGEEEGLPVVARAPRTRGQVIRKALGDYLREASVLVGVFGLLDYFLKSSDPLSGWWIPIAMVFSGILFAAGVYFEIGAER
jgi:hypothetical protein